MEERYESPFRIGLCVFVSLPSGPSGDWSGTSGIQKLLGKRAVTLLEPYERERVLSASKRFLSNGGVVVTLHRNAWEGLRRDTLLLISLMYLIIQGRRSFGWTILI